MFCSREYSKYAYFGNSNNQDFLYVCADEKFYFYIIFPGVSVFGGLLLCDLMIYWTNKAITFHISHVNLFYSNKCLGSKIEVPEDFEYPTCSVRWICLLVDTVCEWWWDDLGITQFTEWIDNLNWQMRHMLFEFIDFLLMFRKMRCRAFSTIAWFCRSELSKGHIKWQFLDGIK